MMKSTALEMILWDDQALVNYQKPSEFTQEIAFKYGKGLEKLDTILGHKENIYSQSIKALFELDLCSVLQQTTDENEKFPNCDVAMSGLASHNLNSFLHQYIKLLEQLVKDYLIYKRTGDPSNPYERLAILTREEYSSSYAYLFYNLYGTMDGIYYSITMSLIPMLTKYLQTLPRSLHLLDLTSEFSLVLLGVWTVIFFNSSVRENHRAFDKLIYAVPLAVLHRGRQTGWIKKQMR